MAKQKTRTTNETIELTVPSADTIVAEVTPEVAAAPELEIEPEPAEDEFAGLSEQTIAEMKGGREALKRYKRNEAIELDVTGQVRGNPHPPANILVQQDTTRTPSFATPGRAVEG